MKKAIVMAAVAVAALATAGLAMASGEEDAKKAGCLGCHAVDAKKMGPSYKSVAAKFAGKKDTDLVAAITVAVLTHHAVRRREAAPAMRSYWPGSLLYASRWVASGRARQNRSWQRGR